MGLDEIRGFEALKYVGKIEIARNNPLERVSGFGALEEGGIDIYTNTSLETLPDFESLVTDGSYNDGIRISNNRILSALPNFDSLKEAYRLEISRSGLISIAGFESLEILKAPADARDSALEISGHYALTEITGFDNLVTNGVITIEDNRSLTSISGFSSQEDGSGITISDNETFDCTVEPQANLPFLPVGTSSGNLVNCPTQ